MAKSKSSSKSRTSSSKKKNLKLKWWYVLPVVAIVAVAGYAIVRSSQASGEYGRRNLATNPPLTCQGGTKVNKGNFYYPYCNITNKAGVYAAASWTPIWKWYSLPGRYSHYGPYNSFCATVYFSKGATISYNSKINGPAGSYITTTTPKRTYTAPTEGSHEVCDNLTVPLRGDALQGTYIAGTSISTSVTLYVYNSNGGTNVGSMYMR